MKYLIFLVLLISLQSCFLFGENWGGEPVVEESNYEAVYIDRTEFESAVALQADNSIKNAGKIYTYTHRLYINDINSGFHIFNNLDPEHPVAEKFLNAPGATDMAIKEGILYINQATDLIAVELNSDLSSLTVSKRIKDVFPVMLSPDGYYETPPEGKVLINWVLKD
jgi:hypothetical protein